MWSPQCSPAHHQLGQGEATHLPFLPEVKHTNSTTHNNDVFLWQSHNPLYTAGIFQVFFHETLHYILSILIKCSTDKIPFCEIYFPLTFNKHSAKSYYLVCNLELRVIFWSSKRVPLSCLDCCALSPDCLLPQGIVCGFIRWLSNHTLLCDLLYLLCVCHWNYKCGWWQISRNYWSISLQWWLNKSLSGKNPAVCVLFCTCRNDWQSHC